MSALQKAIDVIVEEVTKQIIDRDYERGALGLDREVIAEHCLGSHELDIQHAIAEALGVAIPE